MYILCQDFLVESRIHVSINYSPASVEHHNLTTMFVCRYDVLFLKCCVSFTPDGLFNTMNIFPQRFCRSPRCLVGFFSLVPIGKQWFSTWNSMDVCLGSHSFLLLNHEHFWVHVSSEHLCVLSVIFNKVDEKLWEFGLLLLRSRPVGVNAASQWLNAGFI